MPIVDVGPLLSDPAGAAATAAARQIDAACREIGFFGIVGHGVSTDLYGELDVAARAFFALPDDAKAAIAMERAGAAWRGWFPLEGELTSGVPDLKEGIYFGVEHSPDHPRVVDGTPLHGANLFPPSPPELGPAVLAWLDALRPVADAVMRGIALGLGMPAEWFADHLTADPTILFRIFHYPPPPPDADGWGVGEHTDYGLLTLLVQDHLGGLQVRDLDDTWIDVPATPGVIVCNIGDMLERLTGGRYRSTPHRVRNTSGRSRLSFPYFFDPSWEALVPTLPIGEDVAPGRTSPRWDDGDVLAWDGTYGEYLTAKVAKVFPDLFAAVDPAAPAPATAD